MRPPRLTRVETSTLLLCSLVEHGVNLWYEDSPLLEAAHHAFILKRIWASPVDLIRADALHAEAHDLLQARQASVTVPY